MKKGITLIELIIVIVVLSIIAGFMSWTFVAGLRLWNSSKNRADIRQSGNLAMERMVRELSQASSFTIAQAGQVKFDADVDNDGTDETVTFSTSDSELIRKVDGTETVLTPNVQTFGLSYRDLNDVIMPFPITGGPGGDRDNIRVVIISLTLDKADETVSLSSGVYARNQGLDD